MDFLLQFSLSLGEISLFRFVEHFLLFFKPMQELFCVGFAHSCEARWPDGSGALDSGASGPCSSPGRGHCVVFLGKTLYSHSASLHPGV